jgi:hypothetical protein
MKFQCEYSLFRTGTFQERNSIHSKIPLSKPFLDEMLYLTNSQNKRCLQLIIRPSTAYSKMEEKCDSMFAYNSLLKVVEDLEWTLFVERTIDCDCDCSLDSVGTHANL